MFMTSRFFLALGTALLIVGCSSTPEKISCAQRDWYEVGRHDGAQGATLDHLATYKNECGRDFNDSRESLYTNGRNAGLVEFCSEDNAYQLGRMGIAYRYVCPSTVEESFLTGYRKGQEARHLEVANKKLDAAIDETVSKIDRTENRTERRELAGELEQLKKKRAQNEKTLDRVTK